MTLEIDNFADDFDPRFKVFHELMAKKEKGQRYPFGLHPL
jgi:hypothetical protein